MDTLNVLVDLRPGCSVGIDPETDETQISNVIWGNPKAYTQEEFDGLDDTSNLIYNAHVGLYTPAPFTIPTQEECEEHWNTTLEPRMYGKLLRHKRDRLLEDTDKYAAVDFPHASDEIRSAWLAYRQALRDLPATTEDIKNPVWPEAPNA